jgi:hypothetical protein
VVPFPDFLIATRGLWRSPAKSRFLTSFGMTNSILGSGQQQEQHPQQEQRTGVSAPHGHLLARTFPRRLKPGTSWLLCGQLKSCPSRFVLISAAKIPASRKGGEKRGTPYRTLSTSTLSAGAWVPSKLRAGSSARERRGPQEEKSRRNQRFSRCQASWYFQYFDFGRCGVRRMSGWLWVAFRGRMYQVSVGIT